MGAFRRHFLIRQDVGLSSRHEKRPHRALLVGYLYPDRGSVRGSSHFPMYDRVRTVLICPAMLNTTRLQGMRLLHFLHI